MQKIPLLDIGNVIIKVDFSPFIRWIEERSLSKNSEKAQAFLTSSLFYDYEFGNIGREEVVQRLSNIYQGDYSAFSEKFCDIFPGPVEGMAEAIEDLLARGPVYCLSNTNELHLEHVLERYPILSKVTQIFASHEMHRRKPYPGIYCDVADSLNISPKQLVFFDDLAPNVVGAQRAGLEAHIFQNVEHLMEVMNAK